jgi:hypothetical protein
MTPDRGDVVYGSLGLLVLKTLRIGHARLSVRAASTDQRHQCLNQARLPACKLEQMDGCRNGQSDTAAA